MTTSISTKQKRSNKKHVQLGLSAKEHESLSFIAEMHKVSLTKILKEGIELWIKERKNVDSAA